MSEASLRIALVAGEASGDQLGASLMDAIIRAGYAPEFMGVGGERMAARGFVSLFPQHEIAVNGILPVLKRLPGLIRRIRMTADALAAAKPDLLITIDSPDFGLRVANRLRKAAPDVPVVHWVCPSVWAWRPGRARRMRPHVDRILCLLPFEPQELFQLLGPEGIYVGHPLIERLGELRPASPAEHAARADEAAPLILLLPGSRGTEIGRLLPVIGEAARLIASHVPGVRFVLPAVPHLAPRIREAAAVWGVPVEVIEGEGPKLAAFRQARAALAASGTVTLELALAGVPTVACYRVSSVEATLARRLVRVPSVILPNLALGRNVVPELLQEAATPDAMAREVIAILAEGISRTNQLSAFVQLETVMRLADGVRPSDAARDAALALVKQKRGT